MSAWMPPLLILLGVTYCLFFFNLGSYPLLDMDEPRYAEAAREMLESGNFITPTFNYDLRFDKPVFFYWLVAFAYQIFGISEFSARFFSAVSATLTVLSVYWFGRHWVSSRFGMFAALILATSIEVIGLARMSVTDMTLSFLMTATTLCLFMVAHRSNRWWLAAGLFAGLAVLTKGPVGIVVPGSILTLYALLTGQFKKCFITPWFPVALALCAGISLPWYYLAWQENGEIFIDALLHHNVTRFNGVVSGHDQPIYFFVLVLLAGFLPWTAFLPASVNYWIQTFKSEGLASLRSRFQELPPVYWMAAFGLLWTVFIFIFFTVAQTKLLTYILPLFPGLALLMGATWNQLVDSKNAAAGSHEAKLQKALSWSGLFLVVTFLVVGILFISKPALFMPREAKFIAENPMNALAVTILTGGTACMVMWLFRKKYSPALVTLSATMALVALVAVKGVVPGISQATQGAMLSFLEKAGDNPIITYEMTRPSLTYYARKKIIRVPQHDRVTLNALLRSNPQLYVVTKNSFMKTLVETQPPGSELKLLEQGKRYSLFLLRPPAPVNIP